MKNHWLYQGNIVVEREILVYDNRADAASIFRDMPPKFPVVIWREEQDNFREVGIVHTLRLMSRLGIEGVLKCPRKYHRRHYELSINKKRPQPLFRRAKDDYWLVVFED
ncbi:MAG: hypothetical protein ACREGR_03050 [Minisyncoccia bacterium]